MATSIFNNINKLMAVASYNTQANKTTINLLLDTKSRIEGEQDAHEEIILMFLGPPSQVRETLKEALQHFLEAKQ